MEEDGEGKEMMKKKIKKKRRRIWKRRRTTKKRERMNQGCIVFIYFYFSHNYGKLTFA